MRLQQPDRTRMRSETRATMQLESGREMRGSSEPPRDFNEKTGLRRSVFPIKVAGITFGSQENLNDEEQCVNPFLKFGASSRRSVTPMRVKPDLGNGEETINAPFGSQQNRRLFGQRSSGIGHWGQRVFNGHHESDELSNGTLDSGRLSVSSSSSSVQKSVKNRYTTPDDLPRLTPVTLNKPVAAFQPPTEDSDDIVSVKSVDVEETIVIKPPKSSAPSRPETQLSCITVGSSVLMVDPDDVKYHSRPGTRFADSRPETRFSNPAESRPETRFSYPDSRPETRFSDITITSGMVEVDPLDVRYHNGDTEFEFESDLDDLLEVNPGDVNVHEPRATKVPLSVQLIMGPVVPQVPDQQTTPTPTEDDQAVTNVIHKTDQTERLESLTTHRTCVESSSSFQTREMVIIRTDIQ